MLLNSVNPIDYVLDITHNNKQKEGEESDKNSYKNLKQEEEDEEEGIIENSNALNFNESEKDSLNNHNNNYTNKKKEEQNQFLEPRTKSKKMNNCIDIFFVNLTKFLKLIGPLFCITIITFLIYTYFSTLKNIFPFWYKYFISYENHKFFYFFYKFLISFEFFLTIFNNLLSIIIKPGNVADLKKSKYYKTHSAYQSELLQFPFSFIRRKCINNNVKINWKVCKYCNEIKPLRTHHCSLCGVCVIKMDHHCPWINNCIGQNNHRYFLLFLFHVFCYTILIMILTFPIIIYNKRIFKNGVNIIITNNNLNMKEIKYISVLGICSFVIEIFFCGWNWFLALNGNTTLEFWADRTDFALQAGIRDFSFGNWRSNLFYIFGTKSVFKLLFIPSIKRLPFSGLEISRFIDQEFSIEGIN